MHDKEEQLANRLNTQWLLKYVSGTELGPKSVGLEAASAKKLHKQQRLVK